VQKKRIMVGLVWKMGKACSRGVRV
jgi:hypothetical protein